MPSYQLSTASTQLAMIPLSSFGSGWTDGHNVVKHGGGGMVSKFKNRVGEAEIRLSRFWADHHSSDVKFRALGAVDH